MHALFDEHLRSVCAGFERLVGQEPRAVASLGADALVPGIYLLREDGRPMYVGRTDCVRDRLRGHCSGKVEKSTLAFRMARAETGRAATYRKGESRKALLRDEVFVRSFERQLARVKGMTVQFVEEEDPVRQALLEIYAHLALGTPCNDFENH